MSNLARSVKIADLGDNMNLKQLERVTQNDLKRTAKYHKHCKRLVSFVEPSESLILKPKALSKHFNRSSDFMETIFFSLFSENFLNAFTLCKDLR